MLILGSLFHKLSLSFIVGVEMQIIITIISILGIGVILSQLIFRIQSIMKDRIKIEDIVFFLVFLSAFCLLFFLAQKIGVKALFNSSYFAGGIYNMSIVVVILLIMFLVVILSITQSFLSLILQDLKSKNTIIKNIFKFTIISFINGFIIFLIILLNHIFLPILNFY